MAYATPDQLTVLSPGQLVLRVEHGRLALLVLGAHQVNHPPLAAARPNRHVGWDGVDLILAQCGALSDLVADLDLRHPRRQLLVLVIHGLTFHDVWSPRLHPLLLLDLENALMRPHLHGLMLVQI